MSTPVFTGEIDRRIELMDRGGVDTHVLSFPARIVQTAAVLSGG